MLHRIIVLGLIDFALLGLASCHTDAPQTSQTASIATDLPDRIGGGPVHLYWTTSDRVYRGTCNPDAGEGVLAIPHNCSINQRSMLYDRFKEQLDGGLSQTITELTQEAQRLQELMLYVQDQIGQTTVAIAEQERLGGPLTAELQRLRHDIGEFQIFVTELREQLALITDALLRLNDANLMMQREIVVRQLTAYQGRVNAIALRIPGVLSQLRGITTQLHALNVQLTSLQNRLSNLQVDISQVTGRLQAACDDFAIYGETLSYLRSGITLSIFADNTMAQRNRQFVRRFEQIFGANP